MTSKAHSQAPSQSAALVFMAQLKEFYQQCQPLIHPLLNFLENEFDMKLEHEELDLPKDTFEKTPAQKHIQEAIIPLLMAEFREKNSDCEFHELKDHDIFTAVFHWFVLYDRSVSAYGPKLKHPRTRRPSEVVPKDPAIGAKVLKVSHHIARVLAYNPTGTLPRYAPLGSRFAPDSFYGEKGPNAYSDSDTYSDEDGSTHEKKAEAEMNKCDNTEEKELPAE